MSLEQEMPRQPNVIVHETPISTIVIRGKQLPISPYSTPKQDILMYALLSLNNKNVDNVLCQLKVVIADVQGNVIFDYKKGGWVE